MNLEKVLEQLHEELRDVDMAIASLEQLEARRSIANGRGGSGDGTRSPGQNRRARRKHGDSALAP